MRFVPRNNVVARRKPQRVLVDRTPLCTTLKQVQPLEILQVHAAPGTDEGDGLHPALEDDVLAEYLAGAGADLVLVGHTPWIRATPVDSGSPCPKSDSETSSVS